MHRFFTATSLHRKLLTFVLIGIVVNAIYMITFLIAVKFWPELRLLCSIISYLLACCFQYIANAIFTFQSNPINASSMLRYWISISIGLALSTLMLTLVAPAVHLPDSVALIVVAVSVPAINFVLFSQWVYRR